MMQPPGAGLLRVADTHRYLTDTLGPGRRAAVWVQGCSLHCKGCIVPESWNPNSRGQDLDPAQLAHELLDGEPEAHLTVSGGEPTEQAGPVAVLLATARSLGRNTWVYTGRTIEELLAEADDDVLTMLSYTDVLVDGRFEVSQAGKYTFRGSGNQRIVRLSDALSEASANAGTPGRVEILVDTDGSLSLMGIPAPGFLAELAGKLREKGIFVKHDAAWK